MDTLTNVLNMFYKFNNTEKLKFKTVKALKTPWADILSGLRLKEKDWCKTTSGLKGVLRKIKIEFSNLDKEEWLISCFFLTGSFYNSAWVAT